jgi:hypothetical protein
MGKVYLSLDDLHKLYGLSPAVISAIKKKRKRRRNKKNKINNGTMGNKPSDSSHMTGYSSALAVATQQLQQANINKHIMDINKNNERIILDNEPIDMNPNNPEIQFFNQVKEGVKSGKLKVSKTKTGFNVVDKSLGKKPGPKNNSKGRVEEVFNTPIGKKEFSFSLANNTTQNMNRELNLDVLGDFLDDDIQGALNKGVASEKFVQQDAPVFDETTATIELDDISNQPEAGAIFDDPANDVVLENKKETNDSIDTNVKTDPAYVPKPMTDYNVKQLKAIAKQSNVSLKGLTKGIAIYNKLLSLELV